MPGRKNLILVVSDKMTTNKKKDRNENLLVRMSAKTREVMDYGDDSVELWAKENNSMLLGIFQAFKEDITTIKRMVASGELSEEDTHRVGFVTDKTYQKIVGKADKKPSNIWISNKIENTVIGADPEFLLFDPDGSKVRIPNTIDGFGAAGALGYDGPLAELRPAPATNPIDLVNNIHAILNDGRKTKAIKDYLWRSDCYHKDAVRDYLIGGHIHVGNPIQIAQLPMADRNRFFSVLNKILDELLALPMIRIDNEKGHLRRNKGSYGAYGYFGEFRTDLGRLENRTLSGMWLTHPELAKAVFGTAKAIIDEAFRLIADNKFKKEYMCIPKEQNYKDIYRNNFNGWKDIPLARDLCCLRSSTEMKQMLSDSKAQAVNKSFIAGWLGTLKSFSTYKENSAYIDRLADILGLSVKKLKNMDTDLKKNWLEGKEFTF